MTILPEKTYEQKLREWQQHQQIMRGGTIQEFPENAPKHPGPPPGGPLTIGNEGRTWVAEMLKGLLGEEQGYDYGSVLPLRTPNTPEGQRELLENPSLIGMAAPSMRGAELAMPTMVRDFVKGIIDLVDSTWTGNVSSQALGAMPMGGQLAGRPMGSLGAFGWQKGKAAAPSPLVKQSDLGLDTPELYGESVLDLPMPKSLLDKQAKAKLMVQHGEASDKEIFEDTGWLPIPGGTLVGKHALTQAPKFDQNGVLIHEYAPNLPLKQSYNPGFGPDPDAGKGPLDYLPVDQNYQTAGNKSLIPTTDSMGFPLPQGAVSALMEQMGPSAPLPAAKTLPIRMVRPEPLPPATVLPTGQPLNPQLPQQSALGAGVYKLPEGGMASWRQLPLESRDLLWRDFLGRTPIAERGAQWHENDFMRDVLSDPEIFQAPQVDYRSLQTIDDWQSDGYRDINGYLRGTDWRSHRSQEQVEEMVQTLDNVMKEAKVNVPLEVSRGGSGWKRVDWPSMVGKEVPLPGFTATTTSGQVAKDWERGMTYRITVPKGGQALSMNRLNPKSGVASEMEVLLPRNSKFRVQKVDPETKEVWLEWTGVEQRSHPQLADYPIERMRDYTPEELDWEYNREYLNYALPHLRTNRGPLTKEQFQAAYEAAPLRHLTKREIDKLDYSTMNSIIKADPFYDKGELVQRQVSKTAGGHRDVERIWEGLEVGTLPPPIVLLHDGGLRLMSGNTRQMAAAAKDLNLPVKVVDLRSR